MANPLRVPATVGGRVVVAALMTAAMSGVFAALAGGYSPLMLVLSFTCSFLPFLVFLNTLAPRADPAKKGAEANRRGLIELTSFYRFGRMFNLNLAVKLFTFAMEVTPTDDPARATYASGLATARSARYERLGDPADLGAAIEADQLAASLIAADSPQRGLILSDLASSLLLRYGRGGASADLDGAIEAGTAAVAAIPPGDPGPALALSNLGGALIRRFESRGQLTDLSAAVAYCQRAVQAFPADSPHRCVALSNLAIALKDSFQHIGKVADIDAAVETGRAAVATTPDRHPNRSKHLLNLSTALAVRFNHSHQADDLHAAIDLLERAVAATSERQPDRGAMMSDLGLLLRERFALQQRPVDIDAAVTSARSAVESVTDGNPQHAGLLSNLGLALADRFDHSGQSADLDAAIESGRAAVRAASDDHPGRAMYLSNLGGALLARFERTGDAEDLDGAIDTTRRAVAAVPADHPDRAGYLNNLGVVLTSRYELTGQADDLTAATASQRQAAGLPLASPTIRMKAAQAWGNLAIMAEDLASAADAWSLAVGLLPQLAWHGLDRVTQENELTAWQGLAADGAAIAVGAGQPERAVEMLEQGRTVLWTQALHLRSDLTRLAEQEPGLFADLQRVRDALDRPTGATARTSVSTYDTALAGIDERRRHAHEWDDLVARARQLPGFEHFLEAVPFAELRTAAREGPVVIVNTSRYGCHALVVTAERGVSVVALPAVTFAAAVERATALRDLLHRGTAMPATAPTATTTAVGPTAAPQGPLARREADRHALLEILEWLWSTVAEPVLGALGHTGAPDDDDLPRIWWCPTGPMTTLPLHAAGRHTRTNSRPTVRVDMVAGRVVSSYIPTLAALRRAYGSAVTAPVSQLVVGLPQTPHQAPLPAVREELEVLARYLPPPRSAHHLVGEQATRARVLADIPGHPWLHLACHAAQRHRDPSLSAFTLWDAELTVADLAGLRMDGAEFAFLSACQTATGSSHLSDEAVHLAAAMLLLGYGQVIATLWTIRDASAPLIVDGVYARLPTIRAGAPIPAATALHHAVEALRLTRPADPLLWAPYLHTGR